LPSSVSLGSSDATAGGNDADKSAGKVDTKEAASTGAKSETTKKMYCN
jgi:hypothetical protein